MEEGRSGPGVEVRFPFNSQVIFLGFGAFARLDFGTKAEPRKGKRAGGMKVENERVVAAGIKGAAVKGDAVGSG